MFWVLDIDVQAGEVALSDDAAVDFLEALRRQPVLGVAVAQNLRNKTIGARFDVRVATAEEALAVGREAFRQVLAEAGLGEGGLVRLLVEADEDQTEDEDTAGGRVAERRTRRWSWRSWPRWGRRWRPVGYTCRCGTGAVGGRHTAPGGGRKAARGGCSR